MSSPACGSVRKAPWENGAWIGADGGLFQSTDGGDTWTKLTGNGLPDDILQVNVTISPSDPKRIYAAIGTLTAESVSTAPTMAATTGCTRPTTTHGPKRASAAATSPSRKSIPKDPNTIYVASVVTWKSTDAGKTWFGLRGAPGGDDYQNVFVNPNNTEHHRAGQRSGRHHLRRTAARPGAKWYNQATAQMYHVTADNAFPYRVCGGQQDSGSACVASRSNDGRITFHDWHPVGIEEYGYAAPDPLDPDIVYGGKVTRYDRRTGQIQNVEPKPLRSYRVLRTEPLQFSPVDPHKPVLRDQHALAYQRRRQELEGDQPRPEPRDLGIATIRRSLQRLTHCQARRVAASSTRSACRRSTCNRIWAGTDDGLIWTTADGGAHWTNVTPPELKPFWKVFNMDAGHFDAQTAYAAVNTLRLDDMRPHLFRTHDGGKTWTEIDNGIPDGAATSAIREDPKRKGLLYAGTETQVYVSFDDGDHWQSLRLNMPASSVRDLEVKDDDLIAGNARPRITSSSITSRRCARLRRRLPRPTRISTRRRPPSAFATT